MESEVEQPFVAAIQLFNDKSQVSLRSGALSFYSLHITDLNFLERRRWEQMIENRMLVVYLPVSYDTTNVDDAFLNLNPFQEKFEHGEFLQSLHENV